jgi:type IV pilus assembly protein PilV
MRAEQQRGVSLIEVLVSLVILSVGVLAVVALQLVAKRNNADAAQRTIAAQLAYDMLERMRANSAPARLNEYRTADNAPLGRGSLGDTEPTPNCRTAACTPAQLVTHDRWEWEQTLDGAAERRGTDKTGGLVLPTACIHGPVGGGDGTYTVTIVWRGTVGIPDPNKEEPPSATSVGCGRDAKDASGAYIYGETGDDDRLRRSVSVPSFITARQ